MLCLGEQGDSETGQAAFSQFQDGFEMPISKPFRPADSFYESTFTELTGVEILEGRGLAARPFSPFLSYGVHSQSRAASRACNVAI